MGKVSGDIAKWLSLTAVSNINRGRTDGDAVLEALRVDSMGDASHARFPCCAGEGEAVHDASGVDAMGDVEGRPSTSHVRPSCCADEGDTGQEVFGVDAMGDSIPPWQPLKVALPPLSVP